MTLFHYDFLDAYSIYGKSNPEKAEDISVLASILVQEWDGGYLLENAHILRMASSILDEILEKLLQDQDCINGINAIRSALFCLDSKRSEPQKILGNGVLTINAEKREYLQHFETSRHLIASDEWFKDTYGYDLDEICGFADQVVKKEDVPQIVREFDSHLHDRPEGLCRSDDAGDTLRSKKNRLDPRKNWWKKYHDFVKTLKRLLPEYEKNEDYRELVYKAENISYACDRLGRYDSDMDRITLYLYPIMKWAYKMGVSFTCVMQSVCDHELFHYYHFHFMKANTGSPNAWLPGDGDDSKKVNAIREGLADYFAYTMAEARYLYFLDDNSEGWRKIMKSYERKWAGHDFPLFPYAAADVFREEEDKSGRFPANKRKLRWLEFLNLTWTDPKAPAFRVLLESLKDDSQNHWKNAWEAMLHIDEEIKRMEPRAGKTIHGRMMNFTFELCHIQPGETVEFIEDPTVHAVVCDARHVIYKNKKYTLSGLARALKNNTPDPLRGPTFFTYKGVLLSELRKRFE